MRLILYQIHNPQVNLVRVVASELFNVGVDIRKSSHGFGLWVRATLCAENNKQHWVPEGIKRYFEILFGFAEFLCSTTNHYSPKRGQAISCRYSWIDYTWSCEGWPSLSAKIQHVKLFEDSEVLA